MDDRTRQLITVERSLGMLQGISYGLSEHNSIAAEQIDQVSRDLGAVLAEVFGEDWEQVQ